MDEPIVGFRHRPIWLLAVSALLAVQTWLTLDFFGATGDFGPLLDERPIVTGLHPLHAYHARIGAAHRADFDTATCYDPAFQAGYPKTPVFDGACRPAELALTIFPDSDPNRVYKLGLALTCILVPLAIVLAGRGFGLSPAASCFAGAVGVVLWWSDPVRSAIVRGEAQPILLGICAAVHLGWQVRFASWPGLDSWTALTASAAVGWFIDPVGWCVTALGATACYLWVASKQELTWHLSWIAAGAVGLMVNAVWLWDWLRFGWICPPFSDNVLSLTSWPGLTDWAQHLPIAVSTTVVLAGVGVIALLLKRRFALAVLLAAGIVAPVVLGASPEVNAGFLACAAGFAFCRLVPRYRAIVVLAAIALLAYRGANLAEEKPRIGLTPAELALVGAIGEATTPDARILWEEPTDDWSAFLPDVTGRAFLGGLAPDVEFDHQFARLIDGRLAGHPVDDWTDEDLSRFFDRYNVGWVVCHSIRSAERLERYPAANEVGFPPGDRRLFVLDRQHDYILAGDGQLESADTARIVLKNVTPSADGEVVLSFHYQGEMKVEPGYVDAEPDRAAFHRLDPVPFIRLRVPGPVPRLTVTWDSP